MRLYDTARRPSFFKKLSGVSRQPSGSGLLPFALCLLPFAFLALLPSADCLLSSAFQRWLRSSFGQGPVLCYKANRWLRFSKGSQLSAVSHQVPGSCHLPFAICLLPFLLYCLLPTAFCLPSGGFVLIRAKSGPRAADCLLPTAFWLPQALLIPTVPDPGDRLANPRAAAAASWGARGFPASPPQSPSQAADRVRPSPGPADYRPRCPARRHGSR